jgi:hypothetical protein
MAQQQIYTVELDGVEYEIEGDRPPTEQEARQIVSQFKTQPQEDFAQGTITPDMLRFAGPQTMDQMQNRANVVSAQSQGLSEGASGGAEGFVKGLPGGAVDGLLGIPSAIATAGNALWETVQGGIRFAQDPMAESAQIGANLSAIPGQAMDALEGAHRMAATDPERFGENVGRLTGAVETTAATAAATPFIPGRILRGVGGKVRELGKSAKFPLQISGAHQIAMGNPIGGVGLILAPGAMERTGSGMQRLGTRTGAALETMPGRFSQLQEDVRGLQGTKGSPEMVASVRQKIDTLRTEINERRRVAKLDEDIKRVQADQSRLDGLENQFRKLSGQASAPIAPVASHTPSAPRRAEPSDADLMRQMGIGEASIAGARRSTLPTADRLAPRMAPPPAQPPPRLSNMESAALAREVRTPKVPVSDLPPSRTSRDMSGSPGLSENDVRALGLNPANRITGLNEVAATRMLLDRARRERNYIESARLEKRLQDLLADERQ